MRHILALALSAALALPTFTAPARAGDDDDFARLLAGVATLFVIGKAIEMSQEDARDHKKRKKHKKHYKKGHKKGHGAKPHQKRLLPAQCLKNRGGYRMMAAGCLKRKYGSTDHLPRACYTRVFTQDGPRKGFEPGCLRERGYVIGWN